MTLMQRTTNILECGWSTGGFGSPGMKCGEVPTVVEIRKDDWGLAFPRCGRHRRELAPDNDANEQWHVVRIESAARVQALMASVAVLDQQAEFAQGGEDGPHTPDDAADAKVLFSATTIIVGKLHDLITQATPPAGDRDHHD